MSSPPKGRPGPGRRREMGASAIEFAFIFPILFLLVYGGVVYGYVFFLNQSLHFASQQAAEAALSVDPAVRDWNTLRQQRINETVLRSLSWMSESQRSARLVVCQSADCPVVDDTLTVTLEFRLTAPSRLFPVVYFPGMGHVPPLPDTLMATAAVLMQ